MITNIQIEDKIEETVLLVGMGATNKYYMEVVQPESSEEMHEVFGECDFTDSFDILFDGHKDKGIFVMNIESLHDYLEAAQLLQSYSFTYIVPVDIGISNSFIDPTNDNEQRTYYLSYFIKRCNLRDDSIVLITDNHASLYEDIDAFLDDMDSKLQAFKANSNTGDVRQNIVFVANNVVNVAYANAVMARMLLNSEVNEYPFEDTERRAIFDIDHTDKINDMAYFRNHADGSFTVENLLNLYQGESPIKIFTAYRICCYISRVLNFDNFVGSAYTMYKKQQIASMVDIELNRMVGKYILEYRIDEVTAQEDFLHPGTVNIVVKYSIRPINCMERFIQRMVVA